MLKYKLLAYCGRVEEFIQIDCGNDKGELERYAKLLGYDVFKVVDNVEIPDDY